MIETRWFASPLAGTAGVLAGLGLLAIPLWRLTSAQPVPAVPAARSAAAPGENHAVLRLKLLAPARRIVVKDGTGKTLIDSQNVAAGESEDDARIPFANGGTDLTLEADFGATGSETAVFLTVMPDGYEDQTRYATGTGMIRESLRYDWHTH